MTVGPGTTVGAAPPASTPTSALQTQLGAANASQLAAIVALAPAVLGVTLNPNDPNQTLTAAQATLLKDEFAAGQARSAPDPSGAFASVSGIQGLGDAQMVLKYGEFAWEDALARAEQFAGASSWRLFPTVGTLDNMLQSGIDLNDGTAVNKYLFNLLPSAMQQKYPYLDTGLSQTDYNKSIKSLQATWKEWTGDPAGFNQFTPDQLAQYVADPGSALLSWQEDPHITDQYQWMKQGVSYDQLQQKYVNNPTWRSQVIARFGAGSANDPNAYLQELENPLQPAMAAGGGYSFGSLRTQANEQSRTPVG